MPRYDFRSLSSQDFEELVRHLYFSDLPHPYKEAVLQDDFFLDVIKHKHFNPRLIEWLSTYARLHDVGPDAYRAHISALLESPEGIWAHAFRNQISDAARHVLLCFYTLGEWIDIVDLDPAFVSLHRHSASQYHEPIAPGDFRRSLQELDGAFLSYRSGHASYLNPSIREFVASVISGDREIAEDLLNAAVRFKQVVNLWRLSTARPNSELRTLLTSNLDLFCHSLSRLLYGPSLRWGKWLGLSRPVFSIDMGDESRIGFLVEVAGIQQSTRVAALASQGAASLIASWNHNVVDFPAVLRLLDEIGGNAWFLAHGGREIYRALLNGVLEGLIFARADDWLKLLAFPEKALEWTEADESRLSTALKQYRERGVDDDRSDCTTLDEMTHLRESLDQLSKKFGLDFAYDIERLDEDIAEREEAHERPREGTGISRDTTTTHQQVVTDEDVRQMFITLSDRD